MADTSFLKGDVERYVRNRLSVEYGAVFSSMFRPLVSGGTHQFDAVSADLHIVASIKAASGKTSGGRVPAGKIHASIAELYFLSLVRAPVRLLVLTNPEFHKILKDKLKGRLAKSLGLKLIEWPTELEAKVREVQRRASEEVSGPRRGRSRGTPAR